MVIPSRDRAILRDLARKQREYSQLPLMEKRKKDWTDHNDFKGEKPMIHVELWTFEQDLLPPLRCESDAGREMELAINRNITNHERIGDDRVVYDFFPVHWRTDFRLFDLVVEKELPKDGGVGHQFIHHIKNFPADYDALGQSTWSVDREGTEGWFRLVEDTFGDILPPRMVMGSLGVSLSQHIVHLMGMEAMIFAIMDYPDKFQEYISRIADDHLAYFRWLESEGLLILNNGDNDLGQGSFGYCSEIPRRDVGDGPVLISDLWTMMESQETVSVSPGMFGEFFFPYYERVGREFGMISYGCCEPVHSLWDPYISNLPHVRKVSISPWCDEEFMGERLRGSGTIFHRKPSPNFMGVDRIFDEEGFRKHFAATLHASRGCKLEISCRDVYTLCGDPDRPRRMVGIMREMIENSWQP